MTDNECDREEEKTGAKPAGECRDPEMKLQVVLKFSAFVFWPYSLFFFHTEHMEVTILVWNF